MITDKKLLVRMAIDDHTRLGYFQELPVAGQRLFQLPDRNVWDLVVKDQNGTVIADTEYELFAISGQVKADFDAHTSVDFTYTCAAFSDTELDHYLELNGDDSNKAALSCVDALLASAAKRYDYKAGLKDIKASQVFEQLKELRQTLADNIDAGNDGGGAIVLDRLDTNFVSTPPGVIDISRSDS